MTIDNSSAEMNTTIYSISESPKNGQVIWAGTDDGNLQVTRDGGKSWTNVVGNMPGIGKGSWISWVEAGRYADSTAYAYGAPESSFFSLSFPWFRLDRANHTCTYLRPVSLLLGLLRNRIVRIGVFSGLKGFAASHLGS